MIYNLTKRRLLAKRTFYAQSLLERGRGMIGRSFDGFDAMVFEGCDAIHTMFMGFPIDVLFVDRENIVRLALEDLKPWRFLVHCKDARAVIELPPGTIRKTGTEPGDRVDLRAELSPETIASLSNEKKSYAGEPEAIAPLEETK